MYRDDDSSGPEWPDMDAVRADVEIHERLTAAQQERPVASTAKDIKGYELAGEWNALDDLLEETGGELTPEIEALMESLDATTTEKVEKIALVILRKKSEAKAIKEQAARLTARAAARENAATRMTEYLARVMQAIEKDRIDAPLVTVRFQLNNPSVAVDETVLTSTRLRDMYLTGVPFVTHTPEQYTLDKRAVLDLAKATPKQALPDGVQVVRTSSLRIA